MGALTQAAASGDNDSSQYYSKKGQASIKFPTDSEKLKLVQINNEKPPTPKKRAPPVARSLVQLDADMDIDEQNESERHKHKKHPKNTELI